jgi:hypothetical protein
MRGQKERDGECRRLNGTVQEKCWRKDGTSKKNGRYIVERDSRRRGKTGALGGSLFVIVIMI